DQVLGTIITKGPKVRRLFPIQFSIPPVISFASSTHEYWQKAMEEELLALKENDKWDIISCPSNVHPIGSRLVVLGNKQEYGVNYEETFAPIAKMMTARTIVAIATSQNWTLHQIDVKNSFLHSDLKENIYMKPPPGCVLLLLYVDDIIITETDSSLITSLQQQLKDSFHMKDLGTLTYILGLEVHRDSSGVFLNQHKYTQDLISLAGLQDSSSMDTPLELNVKYRQEEGDLLPDPTIFRQLVGSLNYLTITMPDISFAVQQVSQSCKLPSSSFGGCPSHHRYLRGTSNRGLFFPSGSPIRFNAFSNSVLAGCSDTRLSVTYWCMFLRDFSISWKSKKQDRVSASSTEAEY
ncbi:uncharacterized mitochondrial protein AtMg00810-like, partial [Capsicum annuum]|uniref:uncharacterized mitochondrial protein AtMg00810-like n=1 Tax=Capsicum annuum TaxID=4072 RepID=UPI001FB15629